LLVIAEFQLRKYKVNVNEVNKSVEDQSLVSVNTHKKCDEQIEMYVHCTSVSKTGPL